MVQTVGGQQIDGRLLLGQNGLVFAQACQRIQTLRLEGFQILVKVSIFCVKVINKTTPRAFVSQLKSRLEPREGGAVLLKRIVQFASKGIKLQARV